MAAKALSAFRRPQSLCLVPPKDRGDAKSLRSSTAVSDKRSWRVCAGACPGQHVLRPINGCHLTVAEALCSPCASCGAVMGNLYQYAMRKFSLSGCQTCHGQSFGSTRGALA